jgi:AhpC/TSA family
LSLAKENLKDATGLNALIEAYAEGENTPIQEEARTLIIENHDSNPKIEEVLPFIAKRDRGYDEELLKNVLEKNPSKAVKATASFLLAKRLKAESDSPKLKDSELIPKMKEAIAAFEKIAKDYGNLNLKGLHGTATELARNEIAGIRKSPIGKPSPDIVGPDTDGRNFRLSDYKGKVILLDFWGHW